MTLNIVIFGLSITSSWGNGHATTYRALVKALARRGHQVTFLERDVSWYRDNRDLPVPEYCQLCLYESLADVPRRFGELVSNADLVIVGSFVPDGVALGDWVTMQANGVTAFYDIDTPVTLSKLEKGDADYLVPSLIPRFDIYFSFTGGSMLDLLCDVYGSPRPRALYCGVDTDDYHGLQDVPVRWDLGYLGTYSEDRQPVLERLLIEPARQLPDCAFVVAGSQFPDTIAWPANVERIEHLPPDKHAAFYNAQRFTLNVTRSDMIKAGYAPSVRLFEAAACGTPIISDYWPGIEFFFEPDRELLLADDTQDVAKFLLQMPEPRRMAISLAARRRAVESHSAGHRAAEVERCFREVLLARDNLGRRSGDVEAVA
jgi:spore maturation protein CgeB